MNQMLSAQNVVKQFPGTTALDGMDFDLNSGEVHAVVGENGAGKSTLMKILAGAYRKTSGSIRIQDREVEINSIDESQRNGIFMVYQELMNLPKLSVAENIFLGKVPVGKLGLVDFKKLFSDAKSILLNYGINISPKTKLSQLSLVQKQYVDIIRIISTAGAKIIIIDELTLFIIREEIDKLFGMIRELKKKGLTVIYISHRLDEVIEVADRVSVFRDGKNRGTLERGNLDENEIIRLMLGHSLIRVEKPEIRRSEVIFEAKNVSIPGKISGFNMQLFKGEILGIAGLMGSGKDELVKSFFGLWPAVSKELYFEGRELYLKSPGDAIENGIVYLPEERKSESIFAELSVARNISPMYLFNKYSKTIVSKREEKKFAEQYIKKLNIKTPSPEEEMMYLSGGNQQKAIFARLLAIQPSLMILNDPTRGIDIGSKEEIYKSIRSLSEKGTSIILVSSEIEEITYLANRVIVLSKGEIHGEFVDNQVSLENILRCAVRVKAC